MYGLEVNEGPSSQNALSRVSASHQCFSINEFDSRWSKIKNTMKWPARFQKVKQLPAEILIMEEVASPSRLLFGYRGDQATW